MLRRWLEHPLTRGLDLDDPRTTELRRRVVAAKPFLRRVYAAWYRRLVGVVPGGPGRVLELGSGAGFLAASLTGLLRSEVFATSHVDLALDGQELPFADSSLRAIVMVNVFHHLPQPGRFLAEAARTVREGGVVTAIEPWNTPWSRLVYRRLHHEPFLPEAEDWRVADGGPLSSANGALPWIVFARDRERLQREHPQWRLRAVVPVTPFSYLLAGGISLRAAMPGFTYPAWALLERALAPLGGALAMFAHVVLERRPAGGTAP